MKRNNKWRTHLSHSKNYHSNPHKCLEKSKLVIAMLIALSATTAFGEQRDINEQLEFVITEDTLWEDIAQDSGKTIHAKQKFYLLNEATITFDWRPEGGLVPFGSQAMIQGANWNESDGLWHTEPILVTGGKLHGIATESSVTSIAIWNYQNFSVNVTINNTGIEIENYDCGVKFFNGSLTFQNPSNKSVSIKNAQYGIWTNNQAEVGFNGGKLVINTADYGILAYGDSKLSTSDTEITFENVGQYGLLIKDNSVLNLNGNNFSISGSNIAINAKGNSEVTIDYELLKLDSVNYGLKILENTRLYLTGQELNIKNSQFGISATNQSSIELNYERVNSTTAEVFAAAGNQANINLQGSDLSISSPIIAGAEGNGTISLTAEASSDLIGMIIADGVNSTEDTDPATISLNLGQNTQSISRNTNSFKFQGDAIAANKGIINLNLGNGSYWAGRSDDFKDADSEDWKVSHEGEFNNLIPNLQSSGRVNVTLGDGAHWNVTGQSWVSKLDGNGTIDLRGSETGGYAIHIGEITGSNTFLLNLSKDNKDESDMIYVYDGSGAAEQHVVISNRDEVLNGMKVGDRVRFATVANASGGFVSEGMETEIAGGAVKTFGRGTQIRDAGVKNVNFKVVYEPYNSDQTTSEEDLGYNGGKGFDDVKPGNDYVETIYSQGENPYNVYIQRDEDTAEVTDPDDPTQNVTDAGRTIIDHARANYANAVQLDTLNKRQGEMRFSQGHEDGLWARIRHDDIGKRSSFRLDNTMVEVGVDSRYVKETGEFHTGVGFDYMNGDTDYHHISGEGDLDRYGVWFYTTWLGNEGDYTDFIIKCSLIDNEYKIYAPTTGEKITGDYDNNVISVSLEHGKKYSNEESWFIEPQAQLQYAYVTSAEYTNSQGTDVRLDGIHSLIGRVGVRAGKDVTRYNPFTFYARGDIMHEFMGKQDIKAKDATGTMLVRYENDDTWYSAGLGMSYLHNKDKYYFLEAEKVFGGSNTSSYIVSGGVRFLFD